MTSERPTIVAKPDDRWTVQRILQWTIGHLQSHGSDTPRLDAEVLLAHARGCQRIDLYTHYDDVVSDAERTRMRELVQRRARSEPVAYLVGHREFFGLDFRVTPDVLIPRPDTETLVIEVLELARQTPQPRILDIGTGSGCIAISVAVNCPTAHVTAIDISEGALIVARENAARHSVADRIRFLQGDLFAPLADGEVFDFVVSNPPYIGDDELQTLAADIRQHEPRQALTAGSDGLDVIRRLVKRGPQYLTPSGRLLIEISPEQADAVCELITGFSSYSSAVVLKDLAGRARVVSADVAR